MPEQTPRTLNHFSLVRFTPRYWEMAPSERREHRARWLDAVRGAARATHLYQVAGPEAQNDLLVWSAIEADDPAAAALFFSAWAEALAPARPFVEVRETLWGLTLPSQYTKTRSTQELDPFVGTRAPYLIVYPFVKTVDWYLESQETRRTLMAGHIKVGKQYPQITQLLLYSFGLQDQEFVVVYETDDLVPFLNLVHELRATEARRYTVRDWPLHLGLYQTGETLERWL
ncbi:MAG TPA: chlorite dismutase family protein [Gemmatimonadales bacterium]